MTQSTRPGGAGTPGAGRLTAAQYQPSAGQITAAVVGTAYVVVGLLGFISTGASDFAGHDPSHQIAGITVNPLHNVAHLLVGGLGMVALVSAKLARLYGLVLLVGYGALFAWGLAVADGPNILNLDQGGNVLHAATALVGLLIALLPTGRGRADSSKGER